MFSLWAQIKSVFEGPKKKFHVPRTAGDLCFSIAFGSEVKKAALSGQACISLSSWFVNFAFKRNGSGLCPGHFFGQNGNGKRLINIFETSSGMAHCDMWSVDPHALICYSENFQTWLTGLYIWLNNCSACYIAKLGRHWGTDREKKERSRKTALAQQIQCICTDELVVKKRRNFSS